MNKTRILWCQIIREELIKPPTNMAIRHLEETRKREFRLGFWAASSRRTP